jgi:hypothetical protein
MTKNKARLSILSQLLRSPTISSSHWTCASCLNIPQVGDLVSLSSAPDSKWYLSWVRDIEKLKHDERYTLESIEDGERCRWTNVGLNIYDRERVANRPTWQWDDKQFAFNDRWRKAALRKGSRTVRPVSAEFTDGWTVKLDVLPGFSESDFTNPRTFSDWRKLTIKQMAEYYAESVRMYEAHRAGE